MQQATVSTKMYIVFHRGRQNNYLVLSFITHRENDCDTVSDLMENAQALQGKFELCKKCKKLLQEMVHQGKKGTKENIPCQKCPPIAMLLPKLNLVGSVPESTRAGVLQEIDVMMELQGLDSSFFEKVTSATKLHLSGKGKKYFGKMKINMLWTLDSLFLQSLLRENCPFSNKCHRIQGVFIYTFS